MSSRTSTTTNVTILKQKNGGIPSVMGHVSSLNSSAAASSKQPTLSKNTSTQVKVLKSKKKSQHNKQQQEPKQQQKSSKSASTANNNNAVKKACVSAPTTPQQRRPVLPAKARRVERRKEIVSMTEAIKVELDTPSSTESDDSSSSISHSSPGAGGGGKKAVKKNRGHTNKQQKKAIPTIISATTSTTIISVESTKKRSSSVIDVRKSHVYAGPTFNNAPAPSALPMPAFSPTLLSVDLITSTTTTFTAANGEDDLQRHSQDLMNLLSPKPHHCEFDSDLSEIQRGLRSMLKI
ncbi:hypothetical protein MAM1_0436c10501 [Mucor ambiguus]|uniref:Uncharacterized protein n=1 Tax=Mucor ambiguus TaxID=91626 RepID=A0A0C9MJC5_9FUNG|nr:hypothetical protein MAM1_0436c10501 [Mucor ambiguus]